ncbi:MAG TPA: hypothetical protein VLT33_40000, partial [Labilithrix sp.]|nr:hypothetical protein [Labilithrix sp.]
QGCDARGFDACAAGLVCADDGAGATRCADLAAARALRCASAPSITVGATLSGTVAGASLWDPVEGCASADRRGRPEAIVRLHLDAPLPSLMLATLPASGGAGTTFDSVLSVLDGCGAAPTTIACNDDDPSPTSRVTLTDVAAGDYVVVIDSLTRSGGAFELSATTP